MRLIVAPAVAGPRPPLLLTHVADHGDERGRGDRVLTVPNLLTCCAWPGCRCSCGCCWRGAARRDRRLGDHRAGARRDQRLADGKLARLLDQYSRLGELLDPAVDRLYILAALLGARPARRGAVVGGRRADRPGPGARGVPAAAAPPRLRAVRRWSTWARRPPSCCSARSRCCWAGCRPGWFADLCRPTGYAFAVWGTALYLYTGLLYLAQIVLALRTPCASRSNRLARLRP